MNSEDLRIDIIKNAKQISAYPNQWQFVKITHMPTGLTVTKCNSSQLKARQQAMEELELLYELYKEE